MKVFQRWKDTVSKDNEDDEVGAEDHSVAVGVAGDDTIVHDLIPVLTGQYLWQHRSKSSLLLFTENQIFGVFNFVVFSISLIVTKLVYRCYKCIGLSLINGF